MPTAAAFILLAEPHIGLAKTTARSDIHTTTAHKRLTPVKLATCNRDVDELEQELQLAREKTQHAADQTAALINQEKDVKKTVHKVHTVLIDGVDALISIVRPHCIGEAECFMEALDEIKQVAEQQVRNLKLSRLTFSELFSYMLCGRCCFW